MDILIDRRLRELRQQRGNKQEDLAEHLAVSIQAVSKWERGETMPDITLLSQIAAFYDVTIDDLLGVGEIRKKAFIENCKKKSQELYRVGKIDECIEVWRNNCKKFPNDLECLCELMNALHFWNGDGNKTDETVEEIIAIGERLLRESTDNSLRYSATQVLVMNLLRLNRFDEARKYAETASSVYVTQNVLLSKLDSAQGNRNEGKDRSFDNITTYMELISDELLKLCGYDSKNYERYIYLHELYLNFWNLIFDDGFYGFYNVYIERRHYWLARLYTTIRNDELKVREHLEAAAKCAIDFESLPDHFIHKSTLFGDGWEFDMNHTSRNYTQSNAKILLNELDGKGLMDSIFDRWRQKDWFKAIIAELESAGK